VEAALNSGRCSRVICSTDSDAIAAEAVRAGADVPFRRPAELAGDTAGSLEVLRHAVAHVEGEGGTAVDWVCLIEPTTPLRTGDDIRGAVEMYLAADPPADSVVSLCEVTDAHPAWLRKIVNGEVVRYFPSLSEPARRQDLAGEPVPYRRNGAVYVTRRDVLIEQRSLYGRRCLGYVMGPERSINIDTELELLTAEAVWAKGGGG